VRRVTRLLDHRRLFDRARAALSTGSSTTGSGSAAICRVSATGAALAAFTNGAAARAPWRPPSRRARAPSAFGHRRFGEHVRRRQRDVALLARRSVNWRDDFLDRARGALDLDAVIVEQRRHFLARGAQQLGDLEDRTVASNNLYLM
jgi:hypothetical protein